MLLLLLFCVIHVVGCISCDVSGSVCIGDVIAYGSVSGLLGLVLSDVFYLLLFVTRGLLVIPLLLLSAMLVFYVYVYIFFGIGVRCWLCCSGCS